MSRVSDECDCSQPSGHKFNFSLLLPVYGRPVCSLQFESKTAANIPNSVS